MDEIFKILTDNSEKIWTIISVMIGGGVTYFSTSAAEKRKNKMESQKEKLEKILIPYCTCLESTILEIKKVYLNNRYINNKFDFKEWFIDIRKPLEYLEANKRVYLSKKSRSVLEEYGEIIKCFEIELEKQSSSCIGKYREYIATEMIDFTNVNFSMDIFVSLCKETSNQVKLAIIQRTPISLLDKITCIDFIHNDEPENYKVTSVKLKDDIRFKRGAIMNTVMDIDDLDDDDELSYSLLEFIEDELSDEKEILNSILEGTTVGEIIKKITEKIEQMRILLIKEIDKIAR